LPPPAGVPAGGLTKDEWRASMIEARASSRFIRIGPRKVRLVVDLIRGHGVEDALHTLRFLRKGARVPVEKTLRSAVANVFNTKEGANLDPSDLYVKAAYVDEGPTLKRVRPGPMGRAMMIRKRMCHITVVVCERAGKPGAQAKVEPAEKAEKAEKVTKRAEKAAKKA
jgi:large subunit ribosomal protein L22